MEDTGIETGRQGETLELADSARIGHGDNSAVGCQPSVVVADSLLTVGGGRVGSSSRGAAGDHPPSIDKGGVTLENNKLGKLENLGKPDTVGIDYLTLSVSTSEAERFLRCSPDAETMPGYRQPGFRKSEQRQIVGGWVWRKWSPYVASTDWGLQYESWLGSGEVGGFLLDSFTGFDIRPSRVDVAFDFCVSDDVASADFVDLVRPHVLAKKIKIGVNGIENPSGVSDLTQYIGTRSSNRQIRIYRKDLKDSAFAQLRGAVLRVEIIMRDELARRWYSQHLLGDGYSFASSVVSDMTGFSPLADDYEPPSFLSPPSVVPAQSLAALLVSYGVLINDLCKSGININSVVSQYLRCLKPCRMMRSRSRSRRQAIHDAGADSVIDMALQVALFGRLTDCDPPRDFSDISIFPDGHGDDIEGVSE